MNVTTGKKDGIAIMAISGEIDMYESPRFHEHYLSMTTRESACPLVIDLKNATYIDSSGIGVLFRIFSDMKERNIPFSLCNTVGMVEKLLKLSRMSSILPIEKNLDSAIARVKGNV